MTNEQDPHQHMYGQFAEDWRERYGNAPPESAVLYPPESADNAIIFHHGGYALLKVASGPEGPHTFFLLPPVFPWQTSDFIPGEKVWVNRGWEAAALLGVPVDNFACEPFDRELDTQRARFEHACAEMMGQHLARTAGLLPSESEPAILWLAQYYSTDALAYTLRKLTNRLSFANPPRTILSLTVTPAGIPNTGKSTLTDVLRQVFQRSSIQTNRVLSDVYGPDPSLRLVSTTPGYRQEYDRRKTRLTPATLPFSGAAALVQASVLAPPPSPIRTLAELGRLDLLDLVDNPARTIGLRLLDPPPTQTFRRYQSTDGTVLPLAFTALLASDLIFFLGEIDQSTVDLCNRWRLPNTFFHLPIPYTLYRHLERARDDPGDPLADPAIWNLVHHMLLPLLDTQILKEQLLEHATRNYRVHNPTHADILKEAGAPAKSIEGFVAQCQRDSPPPQPSSTVIKLDDHVEKNKPASVILDEEALKVAADHGLRIARITDLAFLPNHYSRKELYDILREIMARIENRTSRTIVDILHDQLRIEMDIARISSERFPHRKRRKNTTGQIAPQEVQKYSQIALLPDNVRAAAEQNLAPYITLMSLINSLNEGSMKTAVTLAAREYQEIYDEYAKSPTSYLIATGTGIQYLDQTRRTLRTMRSRDRSGAALDLSRGMVILTSGSSIYVEGMPQQLQQSAEMRSLIKGVHDVEDLAELPFDVKERVLLNVPLGAELIM